MLRRRNLRPVTHRPQPPSRRRVSMVRPPVFIWRSSTAATTKVITAATPCSPDSGPHATPSPGHQANLWNVSQRHAPGSIWLTIDLLGGGWAVNHPQGYHPQKHPLYEANHSLPMKSARCHRKSRYLYTAVGRAHSLNTPWQTTMAERLSEEAWGEPTQRRRLATPSRW